jgi:hypothetical protein
MTRHTRTVVVVTGALALAMLVIPIKALAQRQTETVDRTLPFPSGGTLKLNNFTGPVRITAGSGRNFVMKAVRRGTAERLKEIQLVVESSGSVITVEANKRDRDDSRRWRDDYNDGRNSIIETDFEIQVPADARLEIDTFSSDIIVRGISGDQRLKTFSGDLEVDATSGAPALQVETFSGTMRVRLPDNPKGDVEFNTFSGSFDTDYPVSMNSSRRRDIRGQLPGGAGRSLRFKSFSGTLRLTR